YRSLVGSPSAPPSSAVPRSTWPARPGFVPQSIPWPQRLPRRQRKDGSTSSSASSNCVVHPDRAAHAASHETRGQVVLRNATDASPGVQQGVSVAIVVVAVRADPCVVDVLLGRRS